MLLASVSKCYSEEAIKKMTVITHNSTHQENDKGRVAENQSNAVEHNQG